MFTEFVKKIYTLVEETLAKLKTVDDEIKEVKSDYAKKADHCRSAGRKDF